jgi:hypothetical protein
VFNITPLSNDRGVMIDGYINPSGVSYTISYITISTLGDAQDFGDDIIVRTFNSSTSNGTNDRGVICDKFTDINTISYITISTLGDAQDFGDDILERYGLSATSNN